MMTMMTVLVLDLVECLPLTTSVFSAVSDALAHSDTPALSVPQSCTEHHTAP